MRESTPSTMFELESKAGDNNPNNGNNLFAIPKGSKGFLCNGTSVVSLSLRHTHTKKNRT